MNTSAEAECATVKEVRGLDVHELCTDHEGIRVNCQLPQYWCPALICSTIRGFNVLGKTVQLTSFSYRLARLRQQSIDIRPPS